VTGGEQAREDTVHQAFVTDYALADFALQPSQLLPGSGYIELVVHRYCSSLEVSPATP
jgi:hypothetical protein